MEISKKEVELAQEILRDAADSAIVELASLELTRIGGGNSVDIFH